MRLPIGFDRIGWKQHWKSIFKNVARGLPIGFDRIGWKSLHFVAEGTVYKTAYRLASIGFVGNQTILTSQPALISSLLIGFDRISWKYLCND